MGRKDRRKTISIKLHPVHDRDLISWWDGLPKGSNKSEPADDSRQSIGKRILRLYADLPIPLRTEKVTPDHINQLWDQLEYLQNAMGNAGVSNDARVLEDRIYQDLNALAGQIDQLFKMVSGGATVISDLPQNNYVPQDDGAPTELVIRPESPTPVADERLTEEKMAKRQKKLGKSSW